MGARDQDWEVEQHRDEAADSLREGGRDEGVCECANCTLYTICVKVVRVLYVMICKEVLVRRRVEHYTSPRHAIDAAPTRRARRLPRCRLPPTATRSHRRINSLYQGDVGSTQRPERRAIGGAR